MNLEINYFGECIFDAWARLLVNTIHAWVTSIGREAYLGVA